MTWNHKDIATSLTNKKLLLYLAVLAGAVFLVFVGIPVRYAIINGAEQEARMYQTAIQTASDEQLNYSIDTKQGKVLSPVIIKAVDKVKFPEMNKEFSRVEKTEDTYTKHYRTECTYDEDGNVKECHQETYYTWDQTGSWDVSAKEVDMAGRKYSIDLFSLNTHSVDASEIIKGQDGHYVYERTKGGIFGRSWFSSDTEGDKRYSYDVLELPQSGTVFLDLSERVQAVSGGRIGLHTKNPEELVRGAQEGVQIKSTVFTVLWIIIILLELGYFGYLAYESDL